MSLINCGGGEEEAAEDGDGEKKRKGTGDNSILQGDNIREKGLHSFYSHSI